MERLRFIDLFAGLGGFHLALQELGHTCLFACELDEELTGLYKMNFGIKPYGDIRTLNLLEIPKHDVLCAGFPCQPFSKAGDQQGFECTQWGDLFDYVVRILRLHKPKYFILENVPNLARHNSGRTWSTILKRLRLAGYSVDAKVLSPHQFGVPQIRKRTFIVGRRGGLGGFSWPTPKPASSVSIRKVLDDQPTDARKLPRRYVKYLNAWQEFLDLYPKHEQVPSFPIWAMEFGASYPYRDGSPHGIGLDNLELFQGSFGRPLWSDTEAGVLASLPTYAREKTQTFAKWKIDYIQQNRRLYRDHKHWIDIWLPRIKEFPPSFQKFEWNCKGEERSIWGHVVQFRASGIRVKRSDTAPSLVAMTTSQVPVITWEGRYMTVRECSRLQSMSELKYLPYSKAAAFKALGNAVNVSVVQAVAHSLLSANYGERAEDQFGSRRRESGSSRYSPSPREALVSHGTT